MSTTTNKAHSSNREIAHYVVTAHPPGSVSLTAKCSFRSPNSMVRTTYYDSMSVCERGRDGLCPVGRIFSGTGRKISSALSEGSREPHWPCLVSHRFFLPCIFNLFDRMSWWPSLVVWKCDIGRLRRILLPMMHQPPMGDCRLPFQSSYKSPLMERLPPYFPSRHGRQDIRNRVAGPLSF